MKTKLLIGIVIVQLIVIAFLGAYIVKTVEDAKSKEKAAEQVRNSFYEKGQTLDSEKSSFDQQKLEEMDQYYEEKIKKLMSEDELKKVARDQWQYSLTVNDNKFKEDYLYVTQKDFELILTEEQKNEASLPQEVLNSGSLVYGDKSDKFYDHLMIESIVQYEEKIDSAGGITKVRYVFRDVKPGTIITLRLSEPLKERLKLPYPSLEIIVNKVE
jgi:hypothetical protein